MTDKGNLTMRARQRTRKHTFHSITRSMCPECDQIVDAQVNTVGVNIAGGETGGGNGKDLEAKEKIIGKYHPIGDLISYAVDIDITTEINRIAMNYFDKTIDIIDP